MKLQMGSGCTKKSRRTGRDDGKNERTPSIFVGKTFDPSSFGGRGSFSSQRGQDDTQGTIMTPEERRQFIENAFKTMDLGSIRGASKTLGLTDEEIDKLFMVLEVDEGKSKVTREEIDAVLSNLETHRRGTKRVSQVPFVKSICELSSHDCWNEALSHVSAQSSFCDQADDSFHSSGADDSFHSSGAGSQYGQYLSVGSSLDPWKIAKQIADEAVSPVSSSSELVERALPANSSLTLPHLDCSSPRVTSPNPEMSKLIDNTLEQEVETNNKGSNEDILEDTVILSPSEFRRLVTDFANNPPSPNPAPDSFTRRRDSTKEQRKAAAKKKSYY